MSLEGKVAVVTGGAKGIGKEIVKQLAAKGVKVVINYNTSSLHAEALQKECQDLGETVHIVQANVGKFEEAEKLINEAVATFGQIDILVNNAGITKDNLILRMSEDDFDQVIETNLKGAWNLSKVASKFMAKQKYGKIINITSVSGMMGNAGQTNYAASKAGLIGLTMSLAREFARRNITVNAIAPGFIETDMTSKLNEETVTYFLNQIPMNRLGKTEDIAQMCLFLASDASNYITGQVFRVDGGLIMG
ncbi:MAG: 3-oxoacyl-[acyl-carrier-protein] reductase [Candidatus Izemoplasmatales bacterium]